MQVSRVVCRANPASAGSVEPKSLKVAVSSRCEVDVVGRAACAGNRAIG
jgi:hypothetical protein